MEFPQKLQFGVPHVGDVGRADVAPRPVNPLARLAAALHRATFGRFGGRTSAAVPDLPPALADSFRLLALEVRRQASEQGLRTILVMGAYTGDGRTMTVANLGMTLARLGSRVIVVESDARRPDLSRRFHLGRAAAEPGHEHGYPGLAVATAPTHIPGLDLIRASSWEEVRSDAKAMTELLAGITPVADFVILDSPPCREFGDAFFFAPLVDGVVFIIRRRQQDVDAIRHIRARLERLGAHIIGVVYNDKG